MKALLKRSATEPGLSKFCVKQVFSKNFTNFTGKHVCHHFQPKKRHSDTSVFL